MAQTVPLAGGTLTTTLTRIFGPIPPNEEWIVDVRFVVSGTAPDKFDAQLRNGSVTAYRAKNQTIVAGDEPYELEYQVALSSGSEYWARAASNGNVDISVTGTRYVEPTA